MSRGILKVSWPAGVVTRGKSRAETRSYVVTVVRHAGQYRRRQTVADDFDGRELVTRVSGASQNAHTMSTY